MKKNIKLAALVLASVLVLAGCAKTESVDSASEETSVETSTEASVEDVEASVEDVEASIEEVVEEVVEEEKEVASVVESVEENNEEKVAAATLEEYFANNATEWEAVKAAEASTEGLSIEVKGNVCIYTYKVPVALDETTAPLATAGLEEEMSNETTVAGMVQIVKLTEEGAGIDGVTLKVVYIDQNDTEIYTCEFNNQGLVK